MGLWEFLRQWRPSRVTVGVVASILLHLAVVAIVLWGGKILPDSRWQATKGDELLVELPKPDAQGAGPPRGAGRGWSAPRPPAPAPPPPPPRPAEPIPTAPKGTEPLPAAA